MLGIKHPTCLEICVQERINVKNRGGRGGKEKKTRIEQNGDFIEVYMYYKKFWTSFRLGGG